MPGPREAQGFSRGDPELLLDQVDPGGLLGDRVLHLQAGVDFEERHGAVRRHEEFHCPGAGVAGFPADCLGGVVNLPPLLTAEERRGGLLYQLLVPALEGAVAGSYDDHVAVGIRQDLRLDVAGTVQVALHEAFTPTEGGTASRTAESKASSTSSRARTTFMPAPSAAEGCLDGDRQAVFFGEGAASAAESTGRRCRPPAAHRRGRRSPGR